MKDGSKHRFALYIDDDLMKWIAKQAKKLGLTDSAYGRMLLIAEKERNKDGRR